MNKSEEITSNEKKAVKITFGKIQRQISREYHHKGPCLHHVDS